MEAGQIVLIVLLVVVVLALVAWLALRGRRTEALKDRFGPEYDRSVEDRGGRRDAERHLSDVADRRDQLDIQELSAESRERYTGRWTTVQKGFVDDPYRSVDSADSLINDVMRERGYPVDEDFDQRADLVAADHPDVVSRYRAARALHRPGQQTSTENLRSAFVQYRELFGELVGHDRASERPPDQARDVDPAGSADTRGTASTGSGVERDRRDERPER